MVCLAQMWIWACVWWWWWWLQNVSLSIGCMCEWSYFITYCNAYTKTYQAIWLNCHLHLTLVQTIHTGHWLNASNRLLLNLTTTFVWHLSCLRRFSPFLDVFAIIFVLDAVILWRMSFRHSMMKTNLDRKPKLSCHAVLVQYFLFFIYLLFSRRNVIK